MNNTLKNIVKTIFIGILGFLCQGCLSNNPKIKTVFEDVKIQQLAKILNNGNKKEAKEHVLKNHINLDIQGKDGVTLLHWFLLKQNIKAFETLLEIGANPNFNPAIIQNITVMAAAIDDVNYLKLLLKYNANPNIIATRDQTPLIKAANHNKYKSVTILLQSDANLDMQVNNDLSAILSAAMQDNYQMVWYLLQQGADINPYTARGGTLAYYVETSTLKQGVTEYQYKEKVKQFLIEKGVLFPAKTPIEIRKKYKLLEYQ
jgi:ankyrin repeat protein